MRSSCVVEGAESKSGKRSRTVLTRKSTRLLSESKRKKDSTQVTARRNHKKMPAVGMRRATRVFGVVKGADGARVLRSGRRLWPDSGEVKLKKPNDWFSPIKSKGNDKNSGFKRAHVHNQIDLSELPVTDSDNDKVNYVTLPKETILPPNDSERMFRLVYKRKRKRKGFLNVSTESEEKTCSSGDRKFELKYFRRKKRKKTDPKVGFSAQRSNVLTISMDSSYSSISFSLAGFIYSVLSYMRKSRLKVKQLSGFVLVEPISRAFDSNGIHFLQAHQSTIISGICILYGDMKYRPLFSVDFSAIPLCFMYMHSRMLLRVASEQIVLENQLMDVNKKTERSLAESSLSITPELEHHENTSVLHPIFRASKLVGRNGQFRYGLGSRGIQKRRSSLRRRKARNPPFFGPQKIDGSLISEFINARKNHRQSPWFSIAVKFREANSITVGSSSTQSMDSCSCSANLLVTESDKCYRESGVTVMLETSTSCELVLAVKRDGLTKYTLEAEKFMRPHSTNRFTHAIMWSGDNNSWKLEFTDRKDWVVFKNLHKECSDRNLLASSDKTIPVPGICIVSDCVDSNSVPFQRPDSYITVRSDELSRAMEKKTANYDMDSHDEEWLNKVNDEFQGRSEIQECVSEEDFELMIDAFEKRFFCSPDILSHEKAAANLCSDLSREEVVGAVFNYWVKKRKQKKSSSLLRVFQGRQAKREQDMKKPPSRKNRSQKQQPSKARRDEKLRILHCIVGEEKRLDILEQEEEEEEENALIKAEEAAASAKRKMEIATQKRERAQLLMDKADLAAYKAMMALGIAQGAQLTKSLDAAASHFLLD